VRGGVATLSTMAAVTAATAVVVAMQASAKPSIGRLREDIGLGHDWSFRWCAVAAGVRGGPGAPGKGNRPPTLRTQTRCRQAS
jgi:hypothetical protein